MDIQRLIVTTVIPTLLAGLVAIAFVLVVVSNKRFAERMHLSSHPNRRRILLLFIFVVLVMPIVFSLLRGTLLDPKDIAVYAEELLLSIFFVIIFAATWVVVNNPRSILYWCDRSIKVIKNSYRRTDEPIRDEPISNTRSLYPKTSYQQEAGKRTETRHIEEQSPVNTYGNNGGKIYGSNGTLQQEIGSHINFHHSEEQNSENTHKNNRGKIYNSNGDSQHKDTQDDSHSLNS